MGKDEYNRTIMAQLMAQNIPIKLPPLSLSLSPCSSTINVCLLFMMDLTIRFVFKFLCTHGQEGTRLDGIARRQNTLETYHKNLFKISIILTEPLATTTNTPHLCNHNYAAFIFDCLSTTQIFTKTINNNQSIYTHISL